MGQEIIPNTKMTNLMPQSGLRGLMVNGELYCFDAKTGELNWHNPAANQMIVLEQFSEMPMVLLTSRYTKWLDNQRIQQAQVVALQSYDKRTGKRLLDKEEVNNGMYQQFHSVKVDGRTGRVDLTSYNLRITHFLESDSGVGGGKEGGKSDKDSKTTPTPGPKPRGAGPLPGAGPGAPQAGLVPVPVPPQVQIDVVPVAPPPVIERPIRKR